MKWKVEGKKNGKKLKILITGENGHIKQNNI
jgi:hypothetical protein